jgi:anti-sigma28 factor (negative regulator of flagellin synthesis)
MGGIQGIGGVPEPRPDRPPGARDVDRATPSGNNDSSDEVVISSQAQAAAVIADTLQAASTQPDIRADRVAEARAALERGDYRKPDVVATVAERIGKFL